MAAKPGIIRTLTISLMLAAFLIPASAHAIMVKKDLNLGGGGETQSGGQAYAPAHSERNPLSKAQQQALQQAVANDSDPFLDQESEKKSEGNEYFDLEHAKFSYLPSHKGSALTVQAKLTAKEYKGNKSDPAARGRATGKSSALVFNYKVTGTKMEPIGTPAWQEVAATANKKK
jgi:hypothetical protein